MKTHPIIPINAAASEPAAPIGGVVNASALEGDGVGCHSGAAAMQDAARSAGKSEILEQYARDYPLKPKAGPHDQPQSMCPAFGSLRVGLRMRRTATILSGSACCVYGLTFTSHFYGARRPVGYVPFNSETLVTGKLFEDIREAVYEQADPANYDAIVIINLCVPTASGVPLQLLPKEINGVRIIGIDVPGFGVPTHAEAKDVLSGAMLKVARQEILAGPVARPRVAASDKPTVTLLGEMFPADPVIIGTMLAPMGLAAGTVVPTANCIQRLIVLPWLRFTHFIRPVFANFMLQAEPCLDLHRLDTRARKLGCRRLARPAVLVKQISISQKISFCR
jgi:3,8-divinyl chlorophyllide a/chlorophyllide a reductase subunit Y